MQTKNTTQSHLNFADPLAARDSLFMSTNGEPFTTSRAVAERFGKRHDNVLKIVKKLLNDIDDTNFSALHLEERDYINSRGKTQIEYRLSHDGFALLVMGFTGKEALAWKIAFLTAFNQMEAEVIASQQRYLNALDKIRPVLRPVTESAEQGEPRIAIAQRIGKSVNAVTYHRGCARKLGLLAS